MGRGGEGNPPIPRRPHNNNGEMFSTRAINDNVEKQE